MRTLDYAPERLQFVRLDGNEQLRRSRAFLALMRRRRSVRQFSGEPVARELVENAVRAAATSSKPRGLWARGPMRAAAGRKWGQAPIAVRFASGDAGPKREERA